MPDDSHGEHRDHAGPSWRCGSSPPATAASSRLLNCEDELLPLAGEVEIAYFPEATRAVVEGPYDVSLVEGSITTPERRSSASSRSARSPGGWSPSARARPPAASRRCATSPTSTSSASIVYAHPEYLATLARSTPISAHVPSTSSCAAARSTSASCSRCSPRSSSGRKPRHPDLQRLRGVQARAATSASTVAHGTPCLGPVTQAGCGALCPAFDRGCYGCFGPQDTPNTVVDRDAGSASSA